MLIEVLRHISNCHVFYSRTFYAAVCIAVFNISSSLAQETLSPVTSSGLNTHISGPIPANGETQYDITGGTRAGQNLFHSFGDFNVPNDNIANFLNDTGSATSNILGRVTGGNISNIFGTIQTTGFGNANLFLMNPAGIVFGPNASLNVGGSVSFTTADYLRLGDNGRFTAVPNPTTDTLLSTAPVSAYGFLGSNPGAIAVHGSQLTVSEGHEISLVGGNIMIQNGTPENGRIQPARVSAPNGQINLATTNSPGEFLQDLSVGPNASGASFRSFGSAHIAPGSVVDVSQSGNGKVTIHNGHLIMEIQNGILTTATNTDTTIAQAKDTVALTAGSSIISQTSSEDRGPDIQIVADQITVTGSPMATGTPVNIWARTDGSGTGGNIVLRTTSDIRLGNLVDLESTTEFASQVSNGSPALSSGNAGNIELTSTHGNILIIGSDEVGTTVTSQTTSTGHTGQITLSATEGNIILDNSSLFAFASSTGKASQPILITSKNLQLMNGTTINDVNIGSSKPEGINIALSGKLTMAGRSIISTASLSPSGAQAADINIKAKEEIIVTQESFINSGSFRSGPGGNLKIVTDTLQVTDGGQLSSGSTRAPDRGRLLEILGRISPTGDGGDISIQANAGSTGSVLIDGEGSGIFADTEGTGVGGTINVSARTLTIQNGGTISASTTGIDPRATGGSIIVNVTDQVTLTNAASITASSAKPDEPSAGGKANAGDISINAGQRFDMQDSMVTTEATQASGGNIEIKAIDLIRVANGSISSSVQGGPSTAGGNITIDPKTVVLQDAQILASAQQGNGGNITITTPVFLADPRSVVDASSQFGLNGSVTIQSPTSNLSETVGQLASKTSPPQVLLQNRCVALAGGEQSTFILAGRDTLPSQPGGWLSSPVAMEHWTGDNIEEHASGLMVRRVEPRDSSSMMTQSNKTDVLSLRRLTPSGFLVRSFADRALTGCRS